MDVIGVVATVLMVVFLGHLFYVSPMVERKVHEAKLRAEQDMCLRLGFHPNTHEKLSRGDVYWLGEGDSRIEYTWEG